MARHAIAGMGALGLGRGQVVGIHAGYPPRPGRVRQPQGSAAALPACSRGDTLVVWRLTPLFRPKFRRIPFQRHDVAGLGLGIEMQFDPASGELTQDRLDSPLD